MTPPFVPSFAPSFALADCNNFYVACERVFQPELRGVPTVVLSNNDGCIISRSPEAKAMGVAMGEPLFKMRRRPECRDVRVRSANFTLYGDMSRRVMETLARHAPAQEIYSIDECFLDLALLAPDERAAHAAMLRDTVRRWTGIPISIGIGPTKTLAKLANAGAKKTDAGICDLTPRETREAALSQAAVGDVWGIGRRWARKLESLGLKTARDLRDSERSWVRQCLGIVGLRTADELSGVPCIAFEDIPPDKRTVRVSRSFGDMVDDEETLRDLIKTFAARAAEKARRRGLVAGAVHVFVRGNRHRAELPQYARSASVALDPASHHTGAVNRAALAALRQIYRPGVPYKRAGVTLLDLAREDAAKRGLFDRRDLRGERLMAALDTVNRRFGGGALDYGQARRSRTWYMRQAHRSPCYTTRWPDLPVVR